MNRKINLPATLVHEIKGKTYRLDGTLVSINESKELCTMLFGKKTCHNVPMSEVYLNEGLLDKLKDAGKAVWTKIKGVVKSVGGFLFPVDDKGNELLQFINMPTNVVAMKLPNSVAFAPSTTNLSVAEENGLKIVNDNTIDLVFAEAEEREKNEIETYWSRVMKEYIKPENESLSLADTVKLVNETYYHRVLPSSEVLNEMVKSANIKGVLNETSVASLHNLSREMYGEELGAEELVGKIYDNLWNQLNPTASMRDGYEATAEDNDTAKPLIIWGAPGIGKTAIVKKASKLLEADGYKLGSFICKCAALKYDDFELPDTVRNIAGKKMAYSSPKTWLPVFDPKGLTPEQIKETDQMYNSGAYQIVEDDMMQYDYTPLTKDEESKMSASEIEQEIARRKSAARKERVVKHQQVREGQQNGGILFFDEFSRLDPRVTDIMMSLMGERMYGANFILASQWVTIAASNRLTDELLSEDDPMFRKIWGVAKQQRYTHVTYVPTRGEWLDWARDINEDTGMQNVDEMFCKFIENSPLNVWYSALDYCSAENLPDDVKLALSKLGSMRADDIKQGQRRDLSKLIGSLNSKEREAIATYLTDLNQNDDQLSLKSYSPRTWDELINRPMIQALRMLFGPKASDFEKITSEEVRVKDGKEYTVRNIDQDKLRAELDKLPDMKWKMWAKPRLTKVDPMEKLVWTNRFDFWNAWIEKDLIPSATGMNSKPTTEWSKKKQLVAFSPESIKSIWENGEMDKAKYRKEDDIMFTSEGNIEKLGKIESCRWKVSPTDIDKVIQMVMAGYPGGTDQLMKDVIKDVKNIANAKELTLTAQEKKEIIDNFDIKLYNGDLDENDPARKTPVVNFNCLIPDNSTIANESPEALAKSMSFDYKCLLVLKYSKTAMKFANVAKWLGKISIERGAESTGYMARRSEILSQLHSAINTESLKVLQDKIGLPLQAPANSIFTHFEDFYL